MRGKDDESKKAIDNFDLLARDLTGGAGQIFDATNRPKPRRRQIHTL